MSLQGLETENSSLIPSQNKSHVTNSTPPRTSVRKLGYAAFVALLWTVAITGFLLVLRRAPEVESNVTTAGLSSDSPAPRFRVSFPPSVHDQPITGRLMVCIARKHAVSDPQGEDQPRLLVDDSADTQQIFAVDVWDFAPGDVETEHREVNATHAVGYPMLFMDEVPAGEYWVQAVLHPYVEYNRSDGRNLQLPRFTTFESEGGVLTAPGTLYSTAKLALFDPNSFSVDLVLTQVEPELPPLEEPHELLKHIQFRSPSLSEFWGTDVYLKAWVLLPYRFFDDAMKDVHYPMFVYHTHYNRFFEHSFYPAPPANTTTASLREQYGFSMPTHTTTTPTL
ncbi:unnamed protein product [Phytophthora lilii]|uniref:Unnamed protein product n=1 Tax=Phytophthora lilii TaxID=2077276 RepID=A0A9W6X0B1_9STRA|nr:unnamed protein product [Phytophthora lilii]